jgi:hypothetical protein
MVGGSISLVLMIYALGAVIAAAAAVLIKAIVGVLAVMERREAAPAPALAPAAAPLSADAGAAEIPPAHIAAIAAAAYAMFGTHRILRIDPMGTGQEWAVESRLAQHSSHRPTGRR